MSLSIVVIGTLDTKGEELAYLKRLVEEKGHRAILVDCSILGRSSFQPDITREEVSQASGVSIDAILAADDEAAAVEWMVEGVSRVVSELQSSGRLDAIIAIGGTMGTYLGLSAMRALPLGVPKVMVSTVALASFIRPEMMSADLILMSPIVDFSGANSLVRRVLANAVATVVGVAELYQIHRQEKLGAGRTVVGVTTMGTSVCRYLEWLKPLLENHGYELLVFHTVGVGGRFFEQVVAQGWVSGVLDLATNELTNEVCGGSYIAGPDRLETAGRLGIPQLISVGGLEAFGWGRGMATLPSQYRERRIQLHSNITFAVKANSDEMASVGKLMAEKLNKALGPTTVVVPLRGFSEREKPGGVFYDPEGREVFSEALKSHVGPNVRVIELDAHINERSFVEEISRIFFEMMAQRENRYGYSKP